MGRTILVSNEHVYERDDFIWCTGLNEIDSQS